MTSAVASSLNPLPYNMKMVQQEVTKAVIEVNKNVVTIIETNTWTSIRGQTQAGVNLDAGLKESDEKIRRVFNKILAAVNEQIERTQEPVKSHINAKLASMGDFKLVPHCAFGETVELVKRLEGHPETKESLNDEKIWA